MRISCFDIVGIYLLIGWFASRTWFMEKRRPQLAGIEERCYLKKGYSWGHLAAVLVPSPKKTFIGPLRLGLLFSIPLPCPFSSLNESTTTPRKQLILPTLPSPFSAVTKPLKPPLINLCFVITLLFVPLLLSSRCYSTKLRLPIALLCEPGNGILRLCGKVSLSTWITSLHSSYLRFHTATV